MDFLVFLDLIIKSNELFVEVFISCPWDPAPAGRSSLGHNSSELHWGMRNGSDEVVLLHRLVSLGPCASQTSEQNRVTVSAGADLQSLEKAAAIPIWKGNISTEIRPSLANGWLMQLKHIDPVKSSSKQNHYSGGGRRKSWKLSLHLLAVVSLAIIHPTCPLAPRGLNVSFAVSRVLFLSVCISLSLSLFLHHLSQWISVTNMQVSSQEEENLWANSTGWG